MREARYFKFGEQIDHVQVVLANGWINCPLRGEGGGSGQGGKLSPDVFVVHF